MSNNTPAVYKHQVPTIAEIQSDLGTAMSQDKLNIICNQPPPQTWLKQNDFVKLKVAGAWKKADYLPIDKVKYLLTRVFGRWKLEIKDTKIMGNSVVSFVRLWVYNPTYQEWDYHDGVGAVKIQQDAGASATDTESIKANAFQLAAPASISYALKDAAGNFGPLFGGNLNKDNALYYSGQYSNVEIKVEQTKEPEQPVNGMPGISTSF